MRIYLAGPMRGYADLNFPAFDAAADELRAKGHDVFNPAQHDRAKQALGMEVTVREALKDDMAWICENAEALVLLDGWDKSAGATAEMFVATAIGIPVYPLEEALSGEYF